MTLKGIVKTGLGIGGKLGYPTANLECRGSKYPAPGVYAARCMADGEAHDAVAIIGARQENSRPLVEVLLLNFQGDLYGKELAIEVLDKISEIERLENDAKLINKIAKDVNKARVCLQELSKRPGVS